MGSSILKVYIFNQLTLQPEVFSSVSEAVTRLAEIKPIFLEQESYRFSITCEEVSGNNTVWRPADLVADPDEGVYFVFNTLTGVHEKVVGKQAAILRMNEIKELFSEHMGLDSYSEVEDPLVIGAQTL
jgi:hypothetical protein